MFRSPRTPPQMFFRVLPVFAVFRRCSGSHPFPPDSAILHRVPRLLRRGPVFHGSAPLLCGTPAGAAGTKVRGKEKSAMNLS